MGHLEVYDAVVSLMRDLELLLSSYDRLFSSNWECCYLWKLEIENIYQNVSSIDSLLRNSSPSGSQTYDRLLTDQFSDAIVQIAREAGNYVDSHISNVALIGFGDPALTLRRSFPSCNYSGWEELLGEISEDANRIGIDVNILPGHSERREYLRNRFGAGCIRGILNTGSTHASLTQGVNRGSRATELRPTLHRLIDETSEHSLHAISDLDGISKTNLARSFYEHPHVVSHFDVRVWITLSKQESVKLVLERLYDAIGLYKWFLVQRSYSFRRYLRHRRCLIVVDDISSQKDWSDLKEHLMIEHNGSRIILTSQYDDVYLKDIRPLYIGNLTPTESWDLLHSKIFPNKSCPDELLLVGKEIATKCRGFPRVILAVGSLLSNMDMTATIWEQVSQRLDSFVVKVSLDTQNAHNLIYNYFLNQMEAFFYYMEVPPCDCEVIQAERKNLGGELQGQHYSKGIMDTATSGSTAQTLSNPMLKLPFMNARNASLNRNVKLVGLEEEFEKLLGHLTGLPLELKIISIRGISGIGKTTTARSLYNHPLVVRHFDFCAWATLSQEYQLRHVLLELLSHINDVTVTRDKHLEEIVAELHRFLEDKRYLIVLDNLSHGEDMHDLVRAFPNDMNGSRIILTSVHSPGLDPSIYVHYHDMRNLNPRESWELLCSKIFLDKSCPVELVLTGKDIANKCQGLPMVIVVIGGLLMKMQKTTTAWKEVARCVGMLPLEDFRIGLGVLHLKNNNLLYQLKACFFNMGTLPENLKLHLHRKFLDNAPQVTLQSMELKMLNIINNLEKIRNEISDERPGQIMEDHTSSSAGSNFNKSPLPPSEDSTTIGMDEEFEETLSCLTGQPSHLKVFSFTGMAGIGKSTFSKRLYDHSLVTEYFYVRAWVTLSQRYQLNKVLLGLLSCIAKLPHDSHLWSLDELTERLYKSLKGQRYLIVLDDMWDLNAWNDLRRAFPNDGNGSRIILTSRLRDLCVYASSDSQTHCLRFLSPEESWELLCSRIFRNESCPPELVAIGIEVANKCQGLPLALVVVGGLLYETTKTLTAWEEVAKSVTSLVMEDPEHCQNIIGVSYSHLSDPLKACLLYMGNFPEDYEIHAQKLINLWVAEGFIPPKEGKCLEEVAEKYLESLVGRNLVMVKRTSSGGRIKICGLHDLIRDFCLREAKKENLLCVIDDQRQEPLVDLCNQRRVAFHYGIGKYISAEGLIAFTRCRSFLCYESLGPTDLKNCSGMYFKLIRVLDISSLHLESLPEELFSLTHLRYLAITIQNLFDISELFRLHSLRTLLVFCEWDGHLPTEFWKMLELGYLSLKGSCVSSVPLDKVLSDSAPLKVLHRLQTLSTIRPINCTEEFFRSMPNLKNLGIFETDEDYHFHGWSRNLVWLQELETLKYVFCNPFVRPSFKERHPLWGSLFPPKLMKLTLSGTSLPWEDMIHLSALPNLEVLKLKNYAFSGSVWKPTEDGFFNLKFLSIGSTNLKLWEADFSPFPRLQHLVLRHCKFLEEIPDVIGDTPSLEKIEMHCCSETAATSARNLQEDKDWLTVYITNGPKMRLLEVIEDAPMWGATISGVNEATYTLRTSQYLGADCGEKETVSTSKSNEIMSLAEEKEETVLNFHEEENNTKTHEICDDEENDDADDLYFDSDDLEYDY